MTTFALNDGDVIVVIGSGASGGTVANELAQRGFGVVCLEAGPRLAMSDIVTDDAVMGRKLTWSDPRVGSGDTSPNFPVFSCKTVGGTTMHWTASAFRLQPFELEALSTYGEVEGTSLVDWPFPYSELEPFYDRAERRMGVTGTHDMPMLPPNNNFKVLEAGARLVGYRQIDTNNMAINSVPRDGRPGCIQLGFCKSGCRIGAKWSTLYTEIPAAEATGNFELRPESMAVRVHHDGSGRVNAVDYIEREGTLQRQSARAVVMACNAVDTPRLLLASASERFPNGLANSSDQLGRNYMRHMHVRIGALMPDRVHHFRGTHQAGSVRDEMRHDPSRGFVGGFNIATSVYSPLAYANGMLEMSGDELVEVMNRYADLASAITMGEDLPEADNRITLHPDRTDRYGLPLPIVHYRKHANTLAMRDYAVQRSRAIYEALGAERVWEVEGGSATHNMGTARMSRDPATGVTDPVGRSHDIENLFIADGSLFPTVGSANPTLTIVALALRQAEAIAAQFAPA